MNNLDLFDLFTFLIKAIILLLKMVHLKVKSNVNTTKTIFN